MQRQLDLMIAAIGDCALVRIDRSGRVRTWSRQAQTVCGIRSREAVGRHIGRLVLPANGERIGPKKTSSRSRSETFGRCVRPDGRVVHVRLIYFPIRSDNGQADGFTVLVQDVTHRSQAQQDRTLLATIVEDSDDAIFVTGLDGRIQTWNRAAHRLFGYGADEAIGKKITTLLIPPNLRHEER